MKTIMAIDGGMKPFRPKEFDEDGLDFDPDGLIFVGDYGKILCEFDGSNPRLIPASRNKSYIKPPRMIERSKGHYEDWIEAIRGGKPARCSFETSAPVTEALNLAVIAMRTGKKLTCDPAGMKTNNEEANKLIKPSYRPGWQL